MIIQVHTTRGTVAYLGQIHPEGGGIVQGLSTSSPLYTLLPRMLQDGLGERTLGAAITVHPQLLQVYHETAAHQKGNLYPLVVEHISHTAYSIEPILCEEGGDTWTEQQYNKVKERLTLCQDDSQRLMVIY